MLKITKVVSCAFWLSVIRDTSPAKKVPTANGKKTNVVTSSSTNIKTMVAMNQIDVIEVI